MLEIDPFEFAAFLQRGEEIQLKLRLGTICHLANVILIVRIIYSTTRPCA
jgi:hypothetical protein